MSTLIFSNKYDFSTNSVIHWLNKFAVPCLRINSDEDKFKLKYINSSSIILEDKTTGKTYNLLDYDSYWYRRGRLSNSILGINDEAVQEFTRNYNIETTTLTSRLNEKTSLIHFLFYKVELEIKTKLGSFFKSGLNRLQILEIAKSVGFKIPNYHIVTNTEQIKDLQAQNPARYLVSKAIDNGIYLSDKNKRYYSYTERIEKDDFGASAYPIYPSLILSEIKKKYELRIFYMVGEFYAMAIFSQNNDQTQTDFRKYSDTKPNRNEPFQLPENIKEKLRTIFQKLDLNTGSVDLIVDDEGAYVFLEINPVGQFGMVSLPCNYNLEKKVAQYLAYGKIECD